MNLTHDQLIDIAYIAATYIAVGAFTVTLYSMFRRKQATSAMNRIRPAINGMDGTAPFASNEAPMSFVKFSELAPAVMPNSVRATQTSATRPVTENEREAVLKLVRERLREVSPAERLADAMSRK